MNSNKTAATLRSSLSLVAVAIVAALGVGCASVGNDGVPVAWEMPVDHGTGGDSGQG